MRKSSFYPDQIVPLVITVVVFAGVTILLYLEILLLNRFALSRELILPRIHLGDVLVGLTIYLKTSIDFAVFIGQLMHRHPGWKNRIMIEIGTALGNAFGTFAILVVWDVFREVKPLMAVMICLASLVLLKMAQGSLEEVENSVSKTLMPILHKVNTLFNPLLSRIVPDMNMKEDTKEKGMKALFIFSLTVPFILGLDDFAGYIPLFNIVNVFGFATGVFLGHMILNIFLFLRPAKTVQAVRNPIIATIGGVAFIALALWGIIEAFKLLFGI